MSEISEKTRIRLLGGGLKEKLQAAWTPNPPRKPRLADRAAAAPLPATASAARRSGATGSAGADLPLRFRRRGRRARRREDRSAARPAMRDAAGPDAVPGGGRGSRRRGQDLRPQAPGTGDRGARPDRRARCRASLSRVSTPPTAPRRRSLSPAPPMPRSTANRAASTIRRCSTNRRMPEATLCGQRMPPPTGMTRSCASSKPSARSATRLEARGARLADALLYETPGSRVDVFVRSRRGAINSRLRRFELAGSDAAVSYRDLVRDMASMGAAGRAGVALRSVWAYRSQRRLLFWAIVAFVLGIVLKMLHEGDDAGGDPRPRSSAGVRRRLDRRTWRLVRPAGRFGALDSGRLGARAKPFPRGQLFGTRASRNAAPQS